MKHLKFLAVIFTSLLMFASYGCSSDEPSVSGKIQSKNLNQLFTGSYAFTEVIEAGKMYQADCDTYGNQSSDWEDVTGKITGATPILPNRFYISKGKIIYPMDFEVFPFIYSEVYNPWKIYCKLTGFRKELFMRNEISINISNNTLIGKYEPFTVLQPDGTSIPVVPGNLYNLDFKILQAEDNSLTLARTDTLSSVNNKGVPASLLTCIYAYQRKAVKESDLNGLLTFESKYECKLELIKMMREYFGKTLDLSYYMVGLNSAEDHIVDFDILEEGIRSGQIW